MRFTFIFLAVFIVTVAKEIDQGEDGDDEAFEDYKKIYKVKYKDKKEEELRKAQYKKCRELVKEHNKKYKKGLVRLKINL